MNARDYIVEGMAGIKGWFYPQDAFAMVAVDQVQKQLGISGGLCEIGVYRGKSLGLMAILAADHEAVTGIDIFTLGQSDMIASQEAVQIATGDPARAKLIQMDTQVVGCDNVPLLAPLRMLHIDGAHDYYAVVQDLDTFTPMCSRGGVVIMDDYHQRDDPGVAVATVLFCENSDWVPFLSSFNKMFLCHRTMAKIFVSNLIVLFDYTPIRVDNIEDSPLLTIDTKKPMDLQQCMDVLESTYVASDRA